MDYLFENLGDERFQEFCSCLISKEFPDSQSFPVGQPDGGRDSLSYSMNKIKKEFIVFQVKYLRNPNSISDISKWLADVIEIEAPKINKLISRGAYKYYLLTNAKGSAHLDSGSKDKISRLLEDKISVPSLCWWRDDLSRLYEKDPIFKWSFPEILNGQDVLNSLIFQNINENRERRESVVKAYLADQYALDNEVKFRQIDLQNKLFDLFTDVPLRTRKINEKDKALKRILNQIGNNQRKIISEDEIYFYEEKEFVGAASFLLNPLIQNGVDKILLEGGPGQGKSTISQYVCQVHRARLLNKTNDLALLPVNVLNTPVRLPFKIDLRHIAAWVESKNPYQGRLSDEYFANAWKNSLESFLVSHIVYHSQIDDFSTADLIAIAKLSSIIFVFDGFDEIADTNIREQVIEFINKGINRISENSRSIQVVITSRPAAFSDTIGFSVDVYPHFELTDITSSITKEYVDKWIKASRLNDREGNEIRRLAAEKLQLPHLKDLAKSPMQLAIFISLLRTRGESLPNKRTALYDSYIELFFNRESEKNPTIRDKRDLIIDIHQYLAWVLHSEAELLKSGGSIRIEDLKARLDAYLIKEGHLTDIADKLFHVMEERVCALVSRVQGTYEFEVQPLREYFCAKYLYNTSPYSPVGSIQSGSKPDRFDAIARNFYWHNVVRFFAGCFDKGELPMLILKLKELQNDEYLKNTNYPRLMTSQILSDWVFTQYPVLLKDVVKIIVDGINMGAIINQDYSKNDNEPILLPNDCGRRELTTECFEQLKHFPRIDYASELIGIIKNNPYQTLEYWLSNAKQIDGEELTKWFEYAYKLELIHLIDENQLLEILQKGNLRQKEIKLQFLIWGNRLGAIDTDFNIKTIAFNSVLENRLLAFQSEYTEHSLQFLSSVLNPYLLMNIIEHETSDISFIHAISRRTRHLNQTRERQKLISDFPINDDIDNSINIFAKRISTLLAREVTDWKNKIEPWDMLVENLRHSFQDKWGIYILSTVSAGIKSRDERYDEFNNLTDTSVSLCKRVRCARMKSGNVSFWESQLSKSSDIAFTLLVLLTWATPKTIKELIENNVFSLNNISSEEFSRLSHSLRITTRLSKLYFTNAQRIELIKYLSGEKSSDELMYLLSYRFQPDNRISFIHEHFVMPTDRMKDIGDIKLSYLINKYLNNTHDETLLEQIKVIYSTVNNFDDRNYFSRRHYRSYQNEIPIELANKIMDESKSYPRIIASYAEKSCRLYANKNIKAVGEVAKNENWFA